MSRVRDVAMEKLAAVVRGQARDPRLAEVAYHFVALCGGPKGFADILQQEFKKADAGSVVRQRIMDMVLRSLKIANDQTPATSDLSQLTDEDLERELALKAQEWLFHAPEEETKAAASPGTDAAAGAPPTEHDAGSGI